MRCLRIEFHLFETNSQIQQDPLNRRHYFQKIFLRFNFSSAHFTSSEKNNFACRRREG